MILPKWSDLPANMQIAAIKPYYDILSRKRISLMLKRLLDCILSVFLLIMLSPLFALIACFIKSDSKGKIFFVQTRVTTFGRKFSILKFRTMVDNAENTGPGITADMDTRVTRPGVVLRKYRLDEIPQLINVLKGEMTFVGTRPEAPKFVEHYSGEMRATLLLPAGITSKASILFKDESILLADENDIEGAYTSKVLPIKMKHNLAALKEFSFLSDITIMLQTVLSFFGADISRGMANAHGGNEPEMGRTNED